MEQTRYGLIGSKLGHSYSKIIHEQIADYTYELMPLPTEDEARAFMERRDFAAINVTIPYKQLVIPYCDVVDPKAAAIGAVNTIVNRDGRLYGYNTDYAGFAYLARAHGVDFAGKTVIPFCTSASSDIGDSAQNLADLAKSGEWMGGMRFPSAVNSDEVRQWVDDLGLENQSLRSMN